MAGDLLLERARGVNTNVRTKGRSTGQEHSSPMEFRLQAEAAYRKAMRTGAASLNKCLDKIILHGHEVSGKRADSRRIYDDIMSVVEHNGHVTLPVSSEPFFTPRQLKVALAVASFVVAVALAVLAKTVS